MIRVGIVGSRRRNTPADKVLVELALAELIAEFGYEHIQLVSGGCPTGADHFAEELNFKYELPKMIIHYPDKSKIDQTKPYRVAYAIIAYARNELIARDSDILIACVAPDRKGGTENTIKHFQRMYPGRRIILV